MISPKVLWPEANEGYMCWLLLETDGGGWWEKLTMHHTEEEARNHARRAMESGLCLRATVVKGWAMGVEPGKPQPLPATLSGAQPHHSLEDK
jgi:hypothetical protein